MHSGYLALKFYSTAQISMFLPDLAVENCSEYLRIILIVNVLVDDEMARGHLVDDDPVGPPVRGRAVHPSLELRLDNLRRHVVRGPAEGPGLVVIADVLLAQAEVCQFDVSLRVQENVGGLEVSVDNFVVVEKHQSHGDLRCV